MAQFCPLPRGVPVSTVLVERGSVSGTCFCSGVEMRLKVISILVAVLKSLEIPYKIIGGDKPEDRDTIIRVGLTKTPAFYTITNDGISYTPGFMDSEGNRFTLTAVMSAVNAAANIDVQVKE